MSDFVMDAYTNISELLDRGDIAPPAPTVARRADGVGLAYRGQNNNWFGNPETGKTLAALCAIADELARGGTALVIDLDHNGAGATISRLIAMGVDDDVLRDPNRFRYTAPDDAEILGFVVEDTLRWKPTVILLDSMGELLPMLGASSNSPDDYTRVHTTVIKPLVRSGAALITIDHLAKNTDSQAFGSTGTAAKKRSIGGTSLRFTTVEPFRPGAGGKSQITINKDRHGGLRAACGTEDREPLAATFRMWDENGDIRWEFVPPAAGERSVLPGVTDDDLRRLSELDPPPTSQRDVKKRLGWGSTRALDALTEWRRRGEPSVLPAPQPLYGEHGSSDPEFQERSRSTNADGDLDAPRSPHTGVGAQERCPLHGTELVGFECRPCLVEAAA